MSHVSPCKEKFQIMSGSQFSFEKLFSHAFINILFYYKYITQVTKGFFFLFLFFRPPICYSNSGLSLFTSESGRGFKLVRVLPICQKNKITFRGCFHSPVWYVLRHFSRLGKYPPPFNSASVNNCYYKHTVINTCKISGHRAN